MFITDHAWKMEGVPSALLAPLVPWHSVLLDISEPCFAVLPSADIQHRQTHVRLFSDIDRLVRYAQTASGLVFAISRIGDEMSVSKVHAVGSYLCRQTGIKFKVYFDDSKQPWPAHSGQPHFSSELIFDVEASFV